jgi:hypothetical protein
LQHHRHVVEDGQGVAPLRISHRDVATFGDEHAGHAGLVLLAHPVAAEIVKHDAFRRFGAGCLFGRNLTALNVDPGDIVEPRRRRTGPRQRREQGRTDAVTLSLHGLSLLAALAPDAQHHIEYFIK